jgi:hypothetical protein
MKATFPHKMKVIVIAIAACLDLGDLRARRQELESVSACAVQGASEERENGVAEDYMGESGKEEITLPIHETTNLVNAACLRQGDEEDAACLSNAVEEQNYRFTACLIQKAMEELSLVEDYMGEGARRVFTERKKQPTHHQEDRGGDQCHGAVRGCQVHHGEPHQGQRDEGQRVEPCCWDVRGCQVRRGGGHVLGTSEPHQGQRDRGQQQVQQQGGGFGRARDKACGLSSCPEAEEVRGGRAEGRGEVHREDWEEGQDGQVG